MTPRPHHQHIKVIACFFNGFVDVERTIKVFGIKKSPHDHHRGFYIIQMLYNAALLPEFIIVGMLL